MATVAMALICGTLLAYTPFANCRPAVSVSLSRLLMAMDGQRKSFQLPEDEYTKGRISQAAVCAGELDELKRGMGFFLLDGYV